MYLTERGVTLIELMIVLVIGMSISAAVYATFIAQQHSFSAQDHVAEMNSTSKIALDMIVNDIRDAGFGVPDSLASIQRKAGCLGINGFTQRISLTDNSFSEDQITLLGAYRQAGTLDTAVSSGATQLVLRNSNDILNNSDRSYISVGGLSFALVTAVSRSTVTLSGYTPLDKSYPAGVPVYLVENVTYRVVSGALQRVSHLDGGGGSCDTHPDTDIVTENTEDLQFETTSPNRMRVNILVRAARPDPDFEGQGNPPTKIGNRDRPATNDPFRRRWRQMEVDMRNPL